MESQRPTQPMPGPDPGLCGCDRDIFLRVWQRVMPEESPECPITVERPEPRPTPVPKPERRPAPAESAGDDFPTPDDVPCLGSGGAADQERLREFTTRELTHWRSYQMLARRSGPGGRMLAALAGGCRRRAKRLSAALFLISGVRFWPAEQIAVPAPRSYFGALREQFLAEQDRGCAYRAAAEDCRDMCLRTLYLDLADECAEHADRIRSLLENM
ncbi:MAG: rubrerythrin [Oscillospiraceae bacterium]